MKEIRLIPQPRRCIAVPYHFIDRAMQDANGDFVKIYLCLLKHFQTDSASLSFAGIADAMNCTEGDVCRALKYWENAGWLAVTKDESGNMLTLDLCQPEEASEGQQASGAFAAPEAPRKPLIPAMESLPADRMKALKYDEEFAQLIFITEQYMGKPVTRSESDHLAYFYDTLGMPADLIEYLIESCVSDNHKSFRYISKVAQNWYAENIRTVEDARNRSRQYTRKYYSVLKACGITNRGPIDKEVAFIDRWMKEYGFDTELICEACQRTIAKKGNHSWEYTESILKDWKEKNVRLLSDLPALDAKHQAEAKKPKPTVQRHGPKTTRFTNFNQRSYDNDSLKKQLLGITGED